MTARIVKMPTFLSPKVFRWHPSLLNSKPSMVRSVTKLKNDMMIKMRILLTADID